MQRRKSCAVDIQFECHSRICRRASVFSRPVQHVVMEEQFSIRECTVLTTRKAVQNNKIAAIDINCKDGSPAVAAAPVNRAIQGSARQNQPRSRIGPVAVRIIMAEHWCELMESSES